MRLNALACKTALGGTLLITLAFMAHWQGFRINTTPSLPKGLYRLYALHRPLQRGDIVLTCASPMQANVNEAIQRGYISSFGDCPGNVVPIMKPIAALAGDSLSVANDGIWVNGRYLPRSRSMRQDSNGRALHPMHPGYYRVQPGTVWLVSSYYERSFDSRYFGPVKLSSIQGVANPVWIW